ncbi:MAG: GxxExxY protein [Planctomycetota bacterium]
MGEWEKRGTGEQVSRALTGAVIRCCIAVNRTLGPGFLESVYHRAMEIEMAEQGIPFETQKEINVKYRGRFVGDHRLDFLVDGRLVVELKTVEKLNKEHYAQVRAYLKAAGQEVGLLVNFAKLPVDVRRVELE